MPVRGPNSKALRLEDHLSSLRKEGHKARAKGDHEELPIAALSSGRFQPRQHFDPEKMNELKRSIDQHGIIQPLLVRPLSSGRYEIVAGERRWQAAAAVGLATVPAIIRDINDPTAMAMALIENIVRSDLDPIDEAVALKQLITECKLTHEAAAQSVSMSRAALTNQLRLLDLGEETRERLRSGQISKGHAKVLLGLEPAQQSAYASLVVEQGMTVRQLEAAIRSNRLDRPPAKRVDRTPPKRDLDLHAHDLSKVIGAKVRVKGDRRGGVRVHFTSLEHLSQLLERLAR